METNSSKKNISVWIFLMRLGARTGCHQMYQRSFSFKGYQFPVCARCTGLLLGQIAGLVFYVLFFAPLRDVIIAAIHIQQSGAKFDLIILGLCAVISVVVLGVDGFFQLKKMWESTNFRRLVTGLFCGFFVSCLVFRVIVMIWHFFL